MYFEASETQSGLGTSRTGDSVGLGTQSTLNTSRTGYPVGDWNWCIPNPPQGKIFSKFFFSQFSKILKRYSTENLMLILNMYVSDRSFLCPKTCLIGTCPLTSYTPPPFRY